MSITYTVTVDEIATHWHLNGQLHREDGPAVECADGTKCWYLNGNLHRADGPAIECINGEKFWYHNGRLHREDGPAVEYTNGNKFWYLKGVELTEKEHWRKTKPVLELTIDDIEAIIGGPVNIKYK